MAETAVQEHDSHAQIDTGWKREPAEAPSARFGWHGQATKTFIVVGWFFTAFLLFMMIGNHTGKIEDIFLVGFALVLAFYLIKGMRPDRGRWS